MTLVIGLTGSIGTGKSTISKQFKALDIPVVDADIIAREVVEPGKKAYLKIIGAFGQGILDDDGFINRGELGKIVFADAGQRQRLNDIVHPEIRKEIIRQRDAYIQNNVPCVVLDIPLLFESELTYYVDKVLVVALKPSTQLQRLMERDGSTMDEAKQRMASQIPVLEKAELADAVIDNNGTVESSFEQLEHILQTWDLSIH